MSRDINEFSMNDTNSMIIDTDAFDFSMLDDMEAEEVTQPKNEEYDEEFDEQDEGFDEDLDDDSEEDEEYEDDEDYDDEDEDLVDYDDEELTELTNKFSERFDEMDDDHVIKFGGLEVTKASLKEAIAEREDTKEMKNIYTNYFSAFQEIDDAANAKLSVAWTDTEHQLSIVNRKLQAGLTGEMKLKALEDREILNQRMAELQQTANQYRQLSVLKRQQMAQMQQQELDKAMIRKYGKTEWYNNVAPAVVGYAKEIGLTEEFLTTQLSPEMIQVLVDASSYRKSKERDRQALDKAMKGKTTTRKRSTGKLKSDRRATPAKAAGKTQRKDILKKMSQNGGRLSAEKDIQTMFDLLED